MSEITTYRAVEAEIWVDAHWERISGFFHCWGYESDGDSVLSVGIIELSSGLIVTAIPTKIHFLYPLPGAISNANHDN